MKDKTKLWEMYKVSADYRSTILTLAIGLEAQMEQVLASHFSKSYKRNGEKPSEEYFKFVYCVFGSSKVLTFDNKREILRRVLLTEDYFSGTAKDKKQFDRMLQEISETRNFIAHRPMDVTDEEIENFDGQTISLFNLNRLGKIVKEEGFILDKIKLSAQAEKFKFVTDTLDDIQSKILDLTVT